MNNVNCPFCGGEIILKDHLLHLYECQRCLQGYSGVDISDLKKGTFDKSIFQVPSYDPSPKFKK